jgi:hypothetical protein
MFHERVYLLLCQGLELLVLKELRDGFCRHDSVLLAKLLLYELSLLFSTEEVPTADSGCHTDLCFQDLV